jgi:hypothetical protein
MGIPIVTAQIGGRAHRMFFDTGAQISYLQSDALKTFPAAGSEGIVGNAILEKRTIGYFPRRGVMVL